jgi:hypothetical protein
MKGGVFQEILAVGLNEVKTASFFIHIEPIGPSI